MRTTQLAPRPVIAPARKTKRFGFGFGRRFFFILLVGLLWAIPAFWDPRFLLVVAAFDLCALVAWAVDFAQLPRPHQLVLERSWNGPPSLSNDVEVKLQLENLGASAVQCRVLDDVPKALRATPPTVELEARRHDSGSTTYIVRPLQRGDVKLGEVYMRYHTSAGFAERWAQADLNQTIRVFPAL